MNNISAKVESLGFDSSQLIVVGSAVMEVLGLRIAGDIDMVGSTEILTTLDADISWKKRTDDDGSFVYSKDNFEIGNNWLSEGPENNFDELIKTSFQLDGVNYVNPEVVLAWKKQYRRPKDIADIELLEDYLRNCSADIH